MIKMERPRFRLEDVDAGVDGSSEIIGVLNLGNEKDKGDEDRTFYGIIEEAKRIWKNIRDGWCGCEDYKGFCDCHLDYEDGVDCCCVWYE